MIKLIACDIDGTLLLNNAERADPEVFGLIKRLKEKGVLFCAASGRQYTPLRRVFETVADDIYYVAENGNILYADGPARRVLSKTAMRWEACMAICHEADGDPSRDFLATGDDRSYICPKQRDIEQRLVNYTKSNVVLVDRPEQIPEELVKISIYCRGNTAAEQVGYFQQKYGNSYQVAVSGPCWVDFNVGTKGTGLLELCRILGVNPQDTMAIGDNYNDLPMLRVVGHPVLMRSAALELRQQFPVQTDTVAQMLRQVLKGLE